MNKQENVSAPTGGIVGWNRASIKNCYNIGKVYSETATHLGGITGCMFDDTANVSDCYNTGEIYGQSYIGGICGVNHNGTINNSYNIGIVKGENIVGSIVGESTIIKSNYYLEGTSTGGINGTDIVGQAETKYAVYMKSSDFVNVLNAGNSNWKLVDGKNNNFPVLNWEDGTAVTREWYAEYSNLNSTGYDVYSYWGGKTESSVQFPTWTNSNGQDDLKWYTAEALGNGVYHLRIKKSEHNNESGIYITHIYYWKSDGTALSFALYGNNNPTVP